MGWSEAVPRQGVTHDFSDEGFEGPSMQPGEDGKIGMDGVESSQRIDLQEIRPAAAVASEIHTAGVPASQQVPHPPRQLGALISDRPCRGLICDPCLVLLLGLVRVDGLGGRTVVNLHHADDPRAPAVADHAGRELAAGKKAFD